MPWRLIGFIIIFGIFLVFIAFNLNNRCDISIVFHDFSDVPVFLTAFFSFVLGMLCTLPFIFSFRRKKREKGKPEAPSSRSGKKKDASRDIPELSPPQAGESPYGID